MIQIIKLENDLYLYKIILIILIRICKKKKTILGIGNLAIVFYNYLKLTFKNTFLPFCKTNEFSFKSLDVTNCSVDFTFS